MVEMAKVVDRIGDFKILEIRRGYLVKNLKGEYENHGHFDKLKGCYKIINLIERRQVPKKDYFIEAAIRLTLDDKYKQSLIIKQEKRKDKQYCYRPQKSVKMA